MPKTKKKKQEGKNCKGKELGSGTVSDKRRELFKARGLNGENSHMAKKDQRVDWEEYKAGNRKSRRLTEEPELFGVALEATYPT